MSAARSVLAALVLGPALAGCGPAKLNEERKYTLEPDSSEALLLEPQTKAQTITIEFSSTASDVSVFLIKSENNKDELDARPAPDKTLGMKSGKEGSLSVEVPPKTMTRVIVRDAKKKTDVTLRVTNAR